MSGSELVPPGADLRQSLNDEALASEILITEADYCRVGEENSFVLGTVTGAWNAVHRAGRRYNYYPAVLGRFEPDTVMHQEVSKWVREYSFARGLYVDEQSVSGLVLKELVGSRELIHLPRVGVRGFRLSSLVVEYAFADRQLDN